MVEMLEGLDYCSELNPDKIDLFKQVIISVESIYRNSFCQYLERV
jgi:hypothetical protein